MFTILNLLTIGLLFCAMLALQHVGYRLARRTRQTDESDGAKSGSSAAEGAVYGLLGLLIAFTFSGASTRYDARRQLVVEEANAIGTAWLRLDILTPSAQAPLRDLFKQYVDARLDIYRASAVEQRAAARTAELQREIWARAVATANEMGQVAPYTVLLPALNDMFDITTTRAEARHLHPPVAVFIMLGVLTLIGSLFAGYGMATGPHTRAHTIGFAAVLALALFVIVDFEFPRWGLIRVNAADSVLMDVRRSMDAR
jgi:hypothetical protein